MNFHSLILEALNDLTDYFNQPLKIGDEITFQGGSAHMSYPEEGSIIGIYNNVKLIVKNSETGKLVELLPSSVVLNDGSYYIDDLDFNDMEELDHGIPVGKNHPWHIKSKLTPSTAKTFGDLVDEL